MDPALLIAFVVGILSSLVAAYVYDSIKTMIKNDGVKLDIEGTWGEFIKASEGRQFSVGKIYFDKRQRLHVFDGTNFMNNGEPYCHWTTVASHVDLQNQQFFYTFKAEIEGQLEKHYHGFGVVNLRKDSRGQLVPADGYYVSASIDGKAMSHSMVKLEDVEYSRSMRSEQAVSLVRANTPPSLLN